MVDAEFENIMAQLRHEASHEADPQAALAEIEREADDYREIAERRVRLGLLLSEIGAAERRRDQRAGNERALIEQAASQYQGKDRERFLHYVQQEPMAAAQLRAPLYEDKVVDFLFSKADITDRNATRAELEADLESRGRPCPRARLRPRPCHDQSKPKAEEGRQPRRRDKPAEAKEPKSRPRARSKKAELPKRRSRPSR